MVQRRNEREYLGPSNECPLSHYLRSAIPYLVFENQTSGRYSEMLRRWAEHDSSVYDVAEAMRKPRSERGYVNLGYSKTKSSQSATNPARSSNPSSNLEGRLKQLEECQDELSKLEPLYKKFRGYATTKGANPTILSDISRVLADYDFEAIGKELENMAMELRPPENVSESQLTRSSENLERLYQNLDDFRTKLNFMIIQYTLVELNILIREQFTKP